MKNKAFNFKFLFICIMLAACLTAAAFANNVTKQKLVLTYDENDNTLNMGIYIAKGTAIVGYCSFDYDSSLLMLLDKDGGIVPPVIPDKSSDGKIYLESIVTGQNGVSVTDVGKGSSKLVNTTDGHLFFAWFLPSTIPYIDAQNSEVLIASADFKLADGVDITDLTSDCVKVASKELTDNVPGWFAGLVVLDKDQKRFTYDGVASGTALFETVLINGNDTTPDDTTTEPDDNQGDNDSQVPSNPDDNVPTTPDNNDGTEIVPDDSTNEPSDDTNIPDASQPDESNPSDTVLPDDTTVPDDTVSPDDTVPPVQDPPSDDTLTQPDTQEPTISTKPDFAIDGNAIIAKQVDFALSAEVDTTNIRVRWQHDAQLGQVDGYTVFVTDDNYNFVKVISGISSVSTSYTISDLASSKKYNIYLVASFQNSYASSKVISVQTLSEGTEPTVLVCNVFYDGGLGYLYGLSSEMCVFGQKPTKTPDIIAPDGKVFIGWSLDENTLVDIEEMSIYSDTVFYALYADAPIEYKGYINGYDDGTFKPDGNITRAEAAVIISRLCDSYDSSKSYSHSFYDVQKGYWYENAVAFCQESGYIQGYSDGSFKPYGNITRAEFATILYRVFGFDNVLGINVFSDLDGHWAKDAVAILYGAGVAEPDTNGKYNPDMLLNRGDAVSMIAGSMNVIPDRASIIDSIKVEGYKFSDVPQYDEKFFDIYSALMN